MRGAWGPFIIGADVNSIVRMGEHEYSPVAWRYRWTGFVIGRSYGLGFLYRVRVNENERAENAKDGM